MSSEYRNTTAKEICSYDRDVVDKPIRSIIHQDAKIILIREGKGIFAINGKQHNAMKNDLIFVLPWDTTIVNEVEEELVIERISFSFEMMMEIGFSINIANGISGVIENIGRQPFIHLDEKELKEVEIIFDSVEEETAESGNHSLLDDIYVTNKLIELLILFNRYRSKRNEQSNEDDSFDIADIIRYIYSHVSLGVSLKELSVIFYMSESSISKRIQDATGSSFTEMVNEIRVDKTMELLTYTDLSLSDIASVIGFSDSSHLIKVFQSRVGKTPNEYRKIYQSRGYLLRGKEKSLAFELISYIDKHFTQGITIKSVSDRFNITSHEINEALQYATEKNFDELVNYLRINRACELLLNSETSINSIAFLVGFSSQRTFTRTFKRLKNVSPSEFRETMTMFTDDETACG